MTKAKLFSTHFVEPMAAYLSNVKAINNQLTVLGKSASEENIVTITIHALLKEDNSFIFAISCNGALLTLNFNELESLAFTTTLKGKQPMVPKQNF